MEQKVTLILTVKNENKTIKSFFDSLMLQTRKPDEVVVVDAFSQDNTMELIKSYEKKIKNLLIIQKKGNRSIGRNTAIEHASHNLIAVTDAGCILDKFWLERLIYPFKNQDIDVVAGYYKPKTNSIFEKCLAAYTCTMPDQLDLINFLPSSRSIAFKKLAWKKVKGYPEYLDTCEDLVFARNLKEAGYKFITQKNAFVWWPQRKNIFQAARQFYGYAKGDGRAKYFRKSTPFLFLRYLIGIVFLACILISKNYSFFFIVCLLLIFYASWSIYKNYKYVKDMKALFYLPLLQLVSDGCVISGTIIGLKERWDTQDKQ